MSDIFFDKNSFPLLFKLLRKEKGMNQKEIARYLNISKISINRWEKGHSVPTIDNLTTIIDTFMLPHDYFAKKGRGYETDKGVATGEPERYVVSEDEKKCLEKYRELKEKNPNGTDAIMNYLDFLLHEAGKLKKKSKTGR